MCMLGYTFMHGAKVFSAVDSKAATSYRFINMIMACTGGGILVPIIINGIPIPMANDAYIIAILTSFAIHHYFPVIRDVFKISPIFKVRNMCLMLTVCILVQMYLVSFLPSEFNLIYDAILLFFQSLVVVFYETLRASVVVTLTLAAGSKIPASIFPFPVFGPIACGAIAGCGGAFLPLNKGLDPIKKGLASPMLSALVAATFLHLFLNTSLSDGIIDAKQKAHAHITAFFIIVGLVTNLDLSAKGK